MFEATAILKANPNFKVNVNSEGEVISLMGLIWDFKRVPADTFNYLPGPSLEAFYQIDKRVRRHGTFPGEIYHLDLGVQKNWPMEARNRHGTADKAADMQEERLSTVNMDVVGLEIFGEVDVVYDGLTPTQIWAHVRPTNDPIGEVFKATVKTCAGARLACRFVGDGNPGERIIRQIISVDLIVEKVQVEVVKGTDTPKVKVPFTSYDSDAEVIDKLFANKPSNVDIDETDAAVDVVGKTLYHGNEQSWRLECDLVEFPSMDHILPEAREANLEVFIGQQKLKCIAMQLVKQLSPSTVSSVHDLWKQDSLASLKVEDTVDLVAGGQLATQLASHFIHIDPTKGRVMAPAVTSQVEVHYGIDEGKWDVQRLPLYILASYSSYAKLLRELNDVPENSPIIDLCQQYDLHIAPLSLIAEDTVLAMINPPQLPVGYYHEKLCEVGIYQRFIQFTNLVFRFALV